MKATVKNENTPPQVRMVTWEAKVNKKLQQKTKMKLQHRQGIKLSPFVFGSQTDKMCFAET